MNQWVVTFDPPMISDSNFSRRRAIKTLFYSSAVMALNLRGGAALGEVKKGGLNFLAIGDFGTGSTDQKSVAQAMQTFVVKSHIKPEALLLIGDNFYGPVKGGFSAESKRWKSDIEEMYPVSVFPGPLYPVLGNHDYHDNEGGETAQLAYAKKLGGRWTLPAKWYRLDLGGVKPLLTLICLDSNLPTVSGTGKNKRTGKPRASLTANEAAEQLEWLKAELAKPRAPFTLVMGHHPLYSNGDHGDTKALLKDWEPLFEEHQVHAYLCGHDHDLQHLEMDGKFTSHILSGGGGARTRKLENPKRTMPYGKDIHGFTHIHVDAEGLTFTHHGVDGGVLHQFTKRRDGKVEMV
jgi:hypothetical protein